MPHLVEMAHEYEDKGVVVVTIHSRTSNTARALEVLEDHDAPFVCGIDAGSTNDNYGVRGIPHAFIIGPFGFVRWRGHPNGGGKEDALATCIEAAGFLGASWGNPFADLDPEDYPRKAERAVERLVEGDPKGASHLIRWAEDAEGDEVEVAEELMAMLREDAEARWARLEELKDGGFYYDVEQGLEIFAEWYEDLDDYATKIEDLEDYLDSDECEEGLDAGEEFAEAVESLLEHKINDARETLEELLEDYPDSPYAARVRALQAYIG